MMAFFYIFNQFPWFWLRGEKKPSCFIFPVSCLDPLCIYSLVNWLFGFCVYFFKSIGLVIDLFTNLKMLTMYYDVNLSFIIFREYFLQSVNYLSVLGCSFVVQKLLVFHIQIFHLFICDVCLQYMLPKSVTLNYIATHHIFIYFFVLVFYSFIFNPELYSLPAVWQWASSRFLH